MDTPYYFIMERLYTEMHPPIKGFRCPIFGPWGLRRQNTSYARAVALEKQGLINSSGRKMSPPAMRYITEARIDFS